MGSALKRPTSETFVGIESTIYLEHLHSTLISHDLKVENNNKSNRKAIQFYSILKH